jgi:hypothetical protein
MEFTFSMFRDALIVFDAEGLETENLMFQECICLDEIQKPRFYESEGPKILFFISGVLLLLGLCTIKSTKEGLEIKFFDFVIEGVVTPRFQLYKKHKFVKNTNMSI